MNCIDLFAGAGGLSEGFIRKGFKFFAHVEMDYAASLTLKTRQAYYFLKRNNRLNIYNNYISGQISREEFYSMIPNRVFKTVINKEINSETIEDIFRIIDENRRGKDVDIIIGGPPCQAYSVIGRSRDPNGMAKDKRNYLYKEYLKFLNKYSPKLFVFENVTGLLSAQNGKIFKDMKKEFLKAGYNIDYKILNAKDFGVLENRKRIILMGWRKDIDFSYPEFKVINNNYTIKDIFNDLQVIKAGEEGNLYIKDINTYLKKSKIRTDNDILTQHISRPNNKRDLEIYRLYVKYFNNNKVKYKYNELPEELITHKNKDSFLDRYNIVPYEGISHTVVAHIAKDGHYYIHPDINQNRSITVREAARIQSFPDNYYFESSRTTAFRQIGNAVPPLMAEKIAKKIKNSFK
ncbi:DNA cytosine methyltransferase [Clostridium perfringens]|uniref:Cytosine-specific methyltransferase n=1 Tax=Clostridium perfringens TaxID=1502 RepID=A0AB37C403_CLOPF|nr:MULTISPECIES: DNA cytosine methyltransferase [Clostridium]ASY51664.1 DNA (cytosine-5-)-methyltransferase [Clostridium perfringens]AWS26178.1 DNA (cytosine-5-)-methyltransferase [Clostridium perfringens]EJT6533447.1 DNA cytosine methyltransferase [Clostridium perfringens]MBS4958046.1 DNA cytosine methyltransferase [Clostridium sp.]MDH2459560.1 DNA cytosine methyltransferase [Clostridium perfringens]